MISRARRTPQEAVREFQEWASLFAGKLLVNIVIYADESGNHDRTGKAPGAREAVICGVAAPVEDWACFVEQWRAVLNKYGVEYFHFREWSDASAVARKKRAPNSSYKQNPFRHLSSVGLDGLVLELATIVGSGKLLIVGGYIRTDEIHRLKVIGARPIGYDAYEENARTFFNSVIYGIDRMRSPWKRQSITFVFDHSDNDDWTNGIHSAYKKFVKRFSRFKEISFGRKTDRIPLQAADMVAYRMRQITAKAIDADFSRTWPQLDDALFENMFVQIKKTGVLAESLRRAYRSGNFKKGFQILQGAGRLKT